VQVRQVKSTRVTNRPDNSKDDKFIGRFIIENQKPMDGIISGQILKFLEELGYKKSAKG
jgi:hypothetical protein